jgi:hypothetical protein
MNASTLSKNSSSFFLKIWFVIFGEVDDFPIFFINLVILLLLCRANIALESPTFAQVNLKLLSINTLIKVDPLLNAFI